MDAVTWFGFLSLAGAMVCYALEERSHWYGLGFAIGCVLGSIYGFLIGAWPFGVVEASGPSSRCVAGMDHGSPPQPDSDEKPDACAPAC